MHPLDGPRLKVRRAMRQIEHLRRMEDAFGEVADYRLIKANSYPERGKDTYYIILNILPSQDWGVCIGEVAHNLRSALDGLVWQLALKSTSTPPRDTQFPIHLIGNSEKRRSPPEKGFVPQFSKGGLNMIKSLHPVHQAAIERLQPYNSTGTRPADHPLHHLNEINLADKHRLILVVGARPASVSWGGFVPIGHDHMPEPIWHDARIHVLEDGAPFVTVPSEVYVDTEIPPYVVFSEGCAAVRGDRVVFILRKIADCVSNIIEDFATAFD